MTTGAIPATSAFPDLDSGAPMSVLDDVACLVLVVDSISGAVVRVNRTLEVLLGRGADQVVGRPWEDLVEPADRAAVCRAIATPRGPLSGIEAALVTPEETQRRILWAVGGEGVRIVLTGVDVTPEGRTSGLFSQLVRTAATPALIGTDLRGRVTLYNSAAERLLGHPAAEMVGRVLDLDIFDRDELVERAARLGVPPDLSMLAGDLSRLDRRRSNLDLGALDRRGRGGDRRAGDDRRSGDAERRGGGGPEDRRERRGTAADRRSVQGLARDWTLVRRDGERFTASIQVVKCTDDDGRVVGYLGVAQDVTEQRRSRSLLVAGLEREAEALRRLKELDRAKDDFVATVSHELRTPITSILGYVEVLLDALPEHLDPAHAEMLEAVGRNGNRLRALADDLLTLSSFESGEFSLDAAPVDLGALVRRVEESVRPLIADRRLETTFAVPVEPVVVTGDVDHLERVLFHLLSNAFKFTEDGGAIGCALTVEGAAATLCVTDTGVGIPPEETDQLFTRFFRSSTSKERASQGAGMGLAIVSAIVERHGGEVRMESEEHHGTKVTVLLPVKNAGQTV